VTANGYNGSVDALIRAAQGADASLNPANGITIVALSQCSATAIDTARPLIVLIDTAPNETQLPGRLGAGWELLTRLYGTDRAVTLLPSGGASTVAACIAGGAVESQAIYVGGLTPLDAFATPMDDAVAERPSSRTRRLPMGSRADPRFTGEAPHRRGLGVARRNCSA